MLREPMSVKIGGKVVGIPKASWVVPAPTPRLQKVVPQAVSITLAASMLNVVIQTAIDDLNKMWR